MGYLDAQAGDGERTAFRRAEKRYKFYKHSSTSARSAKHRDAVPPTDLSDVLDFRAMKRLGLAKGIGITSLSGEFDWPVFIIEKHPGFYFIPEALDPKEQIHWIRESLLRFPQPPNRTNHSAIYGPILDLWSRVQNGEVLEQMNGTDMSVSCSSNQPDASRSYSNEICDTNEPKGDTLSRDAQDCHVDRHPLNEQSWSNNKSVLPKSIPMKSLLLKLRWATLGLQFDWSKRAYDLSLPYNEIPQELSDLASKLARPAMNSSQFHAEAAIVNYFGYDDMLGGHLDDMEADWSKPIVSISLGCKAIFLLGGPSREDNPTAMFLRSGDVVLMAGPARGCFHGVPRIFTDPKESDVPEFLPWEPSFAPFLEYIKMSRINLNIRQVF